jgi:ankyrin repeat protein
MIATDSNNLKIVEYCVSYRADPNLQAKDGSTALHFAAQNASYALLGNA